LAAATEGMGMGTTRTAERVDAAFGVTLCPPVHFEPSQSVCHGGVLLLMPFLVDCGLLSYRNHYGERKGYYNVDTFFIAMSILFLLRIRSIEASKRFAPGELGKLMGLDRIPEVKTLRELRNELTVQRQCSRWGDELSALWMERTEDSLYYIDGHVQVYHGELASLGKKHVSRQRLCLPGMMEYWINGTDGLPFFYVTAEVNEKMIEMLESTIIPKLIALHPVDARRQALYETDPDYPLFTLVFDREGYSPAFFQRLWEKYRIAVLTYRKNVKEEWDPLLFEEAQVQTELGASTLLLHEEPLESDGVHLREIRRLCPGGHQTSIVCTNRKMGIDMIALFMFGRWIQENFFRYMRQDYGIDKIFSYGIEEISKEVMVVNREYSNVNYRIKKEREKLSRTRATLYTCNESLDKEHTETQLKKLMNQILLHKETENQLVENIRVLLSQRAGMSYKVPLAQLPQEARYNKLDTESKHLRNLIAMICYHAETALAAKLRPHYDRAGEEIRALVKTIINQQADIIPDYTNNLLQVRIYPMPNMRAYKAAQNILPQINDTKTCFPGTKLIMYFEIMTI
jgi:hypothetical protein